MNISIDTAITQPPIPTYGSQLYHKSKKALANSMNANMSREYARNMQITNTNKIILDSIRMQSN